jgi:hypothetical protein
MQRHALNPKADTALLNSVARSPARTVLRYGKSGPFREIREISSTSLPNRICGGVQPRQRFIGKKPMIRLASPHLGLQVRQVDCDAPRCQAS